MRRALAMCCAIVLALGGCGDDSDSGVFDPGAVTTAPAATTDPAPPTTELPPPPPATAAPTTTAPPATTTPTTTTTTAAPAPVYTSATYGFFPDPLGTPSDGHGSGCIHDPRTLSDGMWFGFIEAIGGGSVTFDMGCFFTGPAAVAAATADGEEAFDFYIRNMNPMTYSVPVDAGGTAYWLDATGDLTPLAIPMTSWPVAYPTDYQICPDDFCSVWLYVNNGLVTELIEQYLP